MQIPMEILSQMMTRTDSGTGARQRAAPSARDNSNFGDVFDKAQGEALPRRAERRPDTAAAREPEQTTPHKPDNNDNIENDVGKYAGVMGNQNEVIFILEGDMESATTPETCVETSMVLGATRTVQPAATEARPEPVTVADTKEAPPTDVKPTENADVSKVPTEVKHTTNAGAANVEADRTETVKAETNNNNNNLTGEVTARTPIIRTSERHGNEDRSHGFSRNGDLSPLENENDATRAKGQRTTTFSDTVAAVRNAAEGAQEPVNNTPVPLADGIRPEQFRADQQMRQATLDAPVKAENLFEEMVQRLELMQTESQRSMTIHLKPEFLGKVALEIAMDAAGLHVKISAMDSGVRGMINGQINALIESLENKGIEVVKVEVAYTGVDNGAFKENKGQEQQGRNRKQANETDPDEAITIYTALPIGTLEYYLDAGVSSVEYSA